MADLLPVNFDIPTEASIATYSYTDIASGTGIVKFYGLQGDTLQASHAILSTSPSYTSRASIIGTAPQSPHIKDFDLSPFNRPMTIKGTALIEAGMLVNLGASCAAILDIKKVNVLGTPTTIASVSSVSESVSANEYYNLTMPVTIPETDFNVGEKLRLTVAFYSTGNGGYFGTDPKGELWASEDIVLGPTGVNSQLILNMPFKLNL